jgi:4-amino-4-deoxy-L-arabinose transferase-like glycosyltransferase
MNWLLWFVAAACVFSLARDMYDRSAAFTSLLLFSVLPFFVGTGLFISTEAILTIFWCSSLYLLYRALVLGSASAWLWSGIVLGFGIQVDGHLVVVLAGAVIYLLLSKADRHWLQRREFYLALMAMSLTVIPALLLSGMGVATNPYSGLCWLEYLLGSSLLMSYWAIPLFLSPTAVLAGIYVLKRQLSATSGTAGTLDSSTGKNRVFLFAMFILPLILFMLPGVCEKGAIYAASVIWLVLLPGMSLTMGGESTHNPGFARVLAALWWPTIGVLMLVYGIALHLAVL